VVLTFGGEKRDHYLLPYLPMMGLLIALGGRRLAAGVSSRVSARTLGLWQVLFVVALLMGALLTLVLTRLQPHPAYFYAVVLVSVMGVGALVIAWSGVGRVEEFRRAGGGLAIVGRGSIAAVPLVLAMIGGRVFGGGSLDERQAAGEMALGLPDESRVATVGVETAYIVYYGQHFTSDARTMEELEVLSVNPDYAIVSEPVLAQMVERGMKVSELNRVARCRSGLAWVLVRFGDDAGG
jgi:hypothetical protein